MKSEDVARVARRAPQLQHLVVMTMPDCLLVECWSSQPADAESLAARLGALLRASVGVAEAVQSVGPTHGIVETSQGWVLVESIGSEAAAAFVFPRSTALGMARVQVRQMVPELQDILRATTADPAAAAPARPAPPAATTPPAPPSDEAERPRAVRLLEFLQRYAPDPHVSLLRLSLRTGIALEQLARPEDLDADQVELIATSVRDIIGREQLGI